MRKQIILCLKVGWVVAALMILLLGNSICGAADDLACATTGNVMAIFMFLLTIPTGIIFLPIAIAFSEVFAGQFPADFVVWTVFALGGFLQWFYVVPRLLEKRGFTFLNLTSEPETVSAPTPAAVNAQLTAAEPPHPATPPVPPAPARIHRRKQQNQIRSFDKLGRTPLERAINH